MVNVVKVEQGQSIADGIASLDLTRWPARGGTIRLGAGHHRAEEIDVPRGVDIIGEGRFATVAVPQGAYGFRFVDKFNKLSDMQIGEAAGHPDYDLFQGRGVWIQGDRSVTVADVWFHSLGTSYSGDPDIDAAPAAVYVDGANGYTDWHRFRDCDFWDCYRGVVSAGNSHFKMNGGVFTGTKQECVYVLRRDVGGGSDAGGNAEIVSSFFRSLHSEYSVVLDCDPATNPEGSVIMMGCTFERAGIDGLNRHHVYTNLRGLSLVGGRFGGGSSATPGENPHAVYFGPKSTDGVVRGWVSVPGAFGHPEMAGNVGDQEGVEP